MIGVIFLTFLVNGLLILGTKQLAGGRGDMRVLAGAGAAALFAGWCLVPGFGFLGRAFWRVVCFLTVSVLSFGEEREGWRQGGIFMLLCMALEGAASAIGNGKGIALLASAAGIWLVSRYAFCRKRVARVEITGPAGVLRLTALRDTGNGLRDPLTGEGVLVVSASAAGTLTGLTADQLRHPLETVAAGCIAGLRLLPYCSVGMPGGMLLAKRYTKVKIDGAERSMLVAFAPSGLEEEGYQALAGGTCI